MHETLLTTHNLKDQTSQLYDCFEPRIYIKKNSMSSTFFKSTKYFQLHINNMLDDIIGISLKLHDMLYEKKFLPPQK